MASISRETGVSENELYRNKQKMMTTADDEASRMGMRRGHIKPNATMHTDRGSRYSSVDFRGLFDKRFRQSISGKGNCKDNAQAESLFSRFKTEIDVKIFASVEEAKAAAFDYIEC